MNRGQCLVLWGAAVLLVVPYFIKDRRISSSETAAVLFHSRTTAVVRVVGNVEKAGIYVVCSGATVESVTKLTIIDCALVPSLSCIRNTPLAGGEIVEITAVGEKKARIALGKLPAWERIPLGLPLDPDSLTMAEWEYLPSIGPHRAHEIVRDRQINGDFGRLEALKRVPGIGPKTLQQLKPYF